jgi:ribosomal-protein-alanine N-acetyltransferase
MPRSDSTLTSGCDDSTWLEAVSIERMRPIDLDEVLAIERASFPSAWSRQSYLRELRGRNSHYFVARLAGGIIGYAGMWTISDEAHISTIAVRADHRRRGLGSRLLSRLIEIASRHPVPKITLEVRETNHIARHLYRKFGFEETGILPRYYGDTGETGVVMCKTLAPEHNGGQES